MRNTIDVGDVASLMMMTLEVLQPDVWDRDRSRSWTSTATCCSTDPVPVGLWSNTATCWRGYEPHTTRTTPVRH